MHSELKRTETRIFNGKEMKTGEDAFGHALLAYYQNEAQLGVIEREDGYVDVFQTKVFFSEFEAWPDTTKKALKSVKGKILDVGCGAGRHALYLQRNGFDVTAIDRSPLAVKVCRQRGLENVKVMAINQVHAFPRNAYDTVLLLGGNFGLLGGVRRARALLRQFQRVVTPSGRIIAETRDPYQTDNPAHRKYYASNEKRGRMPGQEKIRIRFKQYVGEWYDYLRVSKKEMKRILHPTGWQTKEFIETKDSAYYTALLKEESGQENRTCSERYL